jgi:hypothetical protein
MSSLVRTVTCSPGVKRFEEMKLAPAPSECACSLPVCRPLREPVTTISPNASLGAPRKLIWVVVVIVAVPGNGYTTRLGAWEVEVALETTANTATPASRRPNSLRTSVRNSPMRHELRNGPQPW